MSIHGEGVFESIFISGNPIPFQLLERTLPTFLSEDACVESKDAFSQPKNIETHFSVAPCTSAWPRARGEHAQKLVCWDV